MIRAARNPIGISGWNFRCGSIRLSDRPELAGTKRKISHHALGAGATIRGARLEGVTSSVVWWALRYWTTRPAYLRALADGVRRANLDGSDAEVVTPEQMAMAERQLAGVRGEAGGQAEAPLIIGASSWRCIRRPVAIA